VGGGVEVGCAVSVAATAVAISSTGVALMELEQESKVYPIAITRIAIRKL